MYDSRTLKCKVLYLDSTLLVANQCAIALRQSRLYQTAQAQVQELERLNRLKDDFLSTVSHELRTPMSNIKMATQMLEVSLQALGIFDDKTNVINRYFTVLRDEGQREINLINDLLDLARLDAGREVPTRTPLDLRSFLPYLAEPFIERTRSQQQHLVLHIAADLPPLATDPAYLERIVTELLNNACKYTPAQETITLMAQVIPTGTEIRVSNSGVEVPAAECDRIFDKFYRIPNNDPWKHGGTGLGLALVQKLTTSLGGTIQAESHDRQVHLIVQFPPDTLPAVPPNPEPPIKRSVSSAPSPPR
ncbi:sensor histidine kinase [Trichothermofontia sp.]